MTENVGVASAFAHTATGSGGLPGRAELAGRGQAEGLIQGIWYVFGKVGCVRDRPSAGPDLEFPEIEFLEPVERFVLAPPRRNRLR